MKKKLATLFIIIAQFFVWIANLITKKNLKASKDLQRMKEVACARDGHLWTKFDNNDNMSNPIKNRVYCRRCGQMYHEHEYINAQNN